MRRNLDDYPLVAPFGSMTDDDVAAYARYGMIHRSLHAAPALTMGVVQTAAWSDVWGGVSRTADSTTVSFPRHAYVIEVLEGRHRVAAAPGTALMVNPRTEFRRDAAYRGESSTTS